MSPDGHPLSPTLPENSVSIIVRIRLAPCLSVCLLLPLSSTLLAQSTSPSNADDGVTELDALEVVGRQDAGAYYADETSGAKSHFTLRELPQSVRVLLRQAIDDLCSTRLDYTLD